MQMVLTEFEVWIYYWVHCLIQPMFNTLQYDSSDYHEIWRFLLSKNHFLLLVVLTNFLAHVIIIISYRYLVELIYIYYNSLTVFSRLSPVWLSLFPKLKLPLRMSILQKNTIKNVNGMLYEISSTSLWHSTRNGHVCASITLKCMLVFFTNHK